MGTILAIVVLGILVFVHELGHFLVAKFYRVGVLEFALGFGPIVYRFNYGETTYTIRAIPLGGFVRMSGDDPSLVQEGKARVEAGAASPIEGAQEELTPLQQAMIKDESRWFLKQRYLARCAIVLAGPLFNFLFAWVLASGMYYSIGIPEFKDGPVTVGVVHKDLPADLAGVKKGDRVVTVNGKTISTFKDLVDMVTSSEGQVLTFVIERPVVEGAGASTTEVRHETLTIPVNPKAGVAELDVLEGREGGKPNYRVGISPTFKAVSYVPVGAIEALQVGGELVIHRSLETLRVLRALLTGLIAPHRAIGGPIEIIKQTAASADEGWVAVISMMIFLNITLGVMNLLPIPVLDGGHLTLFTIEKLIGRPLSLRVQDMATRVGMTVLLFLMVFAIGNDLRRALF